jgi:hypothetical protein
VSRGRSIAGPLLAVAALALGAGRAAAATPHCYGAAALDRAHPCHNAALRLSVKPTPSQAALEPGPYCKRLTGIGILSPCAFGAAPGKAKSQFALIGDSHANHWRAGFTALGRAQDERGYELSRPSCSFTLAIRPLPEPYASECVQFRQNTVDWLTRHPTVHTVFIGDLTRNAGEYPPGTSDPFAAQVAGYVAAFQQLPASVTHAYVLRDTPEIRVSTLACVDRARARRRDAGKSCAVAKKSAILPDPAAAAAQQLGGRFAVLDLNSFFCDASRCYPVIGGVLVYKDITHLTPQFAETLAPYLRRAVRQAG